MPAIETVAIINKSGKLVSTSKHLVNIFKDAKDAYNSHKAELKAEHRAKHEEKAAQRRIEALRLSDNLIEPRQRSHRPSSKKGESRPPLTEDNLSRLSGSVSGSRHGSRSGSRRGKSLKGDSTRSRPPGYQPPYFEDGDISRPDLTRSYTEMPYNGHAQVVRRASVGGFGPPARSYSSPNIGDDHIDMNLAYGELPGPPSNPFDMALEKEEKQVELSGLMTKLDVLMLEAQCVQHSATTIISSLQKNPEAMAAVALTLAEISNLLTKMSPGIISALKAGSPAVFALLASPQFLIAGGLAVGVTVVMFGGYKIIKKIQDSKKEKEEALRMDEALVYDVEGEDISSIESWRRGIADVEVGSEATSVSGEFITPAADRLRKERIRDRAREEGRGSRARSEASGTSTIKRKGVPERVSSRSKLADVETVISGYSERTDGTESTVKPSKAKKDKKEKKDKEKEKDKSKSKPKEMKAIKEKEKDASSPLPVARKRDAFSDIFKRTPSGEGKKELVAKGHNKVPLMVEM